MVNLSQTSIFKDLSLERINHAIKCLKFQKLNLFKDSIYYNDGDKPLICVVEKGIVDLIEIYEWGKKIFCPDTKHWTHLYYIVLEKI